VQVQIAPGLPAFLLVGLPDKAVAESRERVRAALTGLGLGGCQRSCPLGCGEPSLISGRASAAAR